MSSEILVFITKQMGLARQLIFKQYRELKNKMNKQNTLFKINNYTCFILLKLKLVRRRCTFNLNGRKLCSNFPNK